MAATLRPATVADAPAAAALGLAGMETYRAWAGPGWEPRADGPRRVAERLRHGWGTVAEDGGDVVGFGAFEPAREQPRLGALVPGLAHVWAVFTAESHWGTGVATELLDALVAEMRRRGLRAARLMTPAGQARARRFYAREGWTEQGPPYAVSELGLEIVELRRPL